jgi:hypothetical protein
MTQLRCETCRWHDVVGFHQYYGAAAARMPGRGYCRRYPPLPDFTRLQQAHQLQIERQEVFVFAFWPETAAEDGCGEWQAGEWQAQKAG